jgi:hypothetical protein
MSTPTSDGRYLLCSADSDKLSECVPSCVQNVEHAIRFGATDIHPVLLSGEIGLRENGACRRAELVV